MRNTVIFDIETRSSCDLIARGARQYAATPDTRIICMTYKINAGDVQTWLPNQPARSYPEDAVMMSFNILFDF